jgi:MATE family multidrug resistance protein
VGFPLEIQTSAEVVAFSVATLLAGTLGATSVAAHSIALNLAALSFMVPLGISQGVATRVGNLIGASVPRDAQSSAWIAMAMGASVMTVSAFAFFAFRDTLPHLYTATIALAASILPLAAAFQIFDGTQAVGRGVLRGMRRTRPAALFNLLGY